MIKFMVVVYRRKEMTPAEFRQHLENIHGPLAMKLPGLRKYTQNYASDDAKRKPPEWDAIVELWFEDRATMEAAWAGPEGAASDADLPAFADLSRTTWSVVEEINALPRRPGNSPTCRP
jgi:uncharacterized protein (TIGR02118 family)